MAMLNYQRVTLYNHRNHSFRCSGHPRLTAEAAKVHDTATTSRSPWCTPVLRPPDPWATWKISFKWWLKKTLGNGYG